LSGAALAFLAPGAAIYFLLPPYAAAIGMIARRWFAWAEQAGAIAAALFLYLTFGPALALFEDLLNANPPWIFAPLGAAILLPVLIELGPLLARARPVLAAAGAVGLAGLGWIAACATPAYSADREQLFTIEYVSDVGAATARFAINNDGAPVPYEAAWERTEMPYTTRRRWAAPAPAVQVPAPAVTLVAQQPVPGGRHLRLRLAMNGAEAIALIAPPEARLQGAGAGAFLERFGHGADTDKYYLRCIGRACDGAMLDIVASGTGPVDFTIVGSRSGLPPVATPLARARPQTARPQYGPDATITVGRVRF
jgi:hypothetical protein